MPTLRHVSVPEVGAIYFNPHPCYLTISENLQQHYSFDPAGRFLTCFLDGANYRRGLDSTILRKQVTMPSGKSRRRLSPDEGAALIADVHERVTRIAGHIKDSEQADLWPWLQTILSWDYARLREEQTAFQQIYKPVSILPPDQYLSIVLQAAEGCSWNKCTFCTLYRDRRFRIKSAEQFRQHARAVKGLLGEAIGMRKSIFLGDANALVIPQRRLLELLDVVNSEFPMGSANSAEGYTLKGIYSFLDIFGAGRKTVAEYRELRRNGLRRIYIGLESGDREVFALLNKPGSPEACRQAVADIKAAGLSVGIILLAGAGGDRFAAQHLAHSIEEVQAMDLGADDIVYISPLLVVEADEYSRCLQAGGGRHLSAEETDAQLHALKRALRPAGSQGPKVSLYHLDEFIY